MKKETLAYLGVFFCVLIGGMILSSGTTEGLMSRTKKLAENASIKNFVGTFVNFGFLSQPPIIQHATVGFVLDNFVRPFVNFGYLSQESLIIQHASVGFVLDSFAVDPSPENGWTGDEYLGNVISQCVFHSQESFEPLCVICKLKDSDGNIIAQGFRGENFDEHYIASSTINIDLKPDPENPLSYDVQKAHRVQIDICQPNEAWFESTRGGTLD